MLRRKGKCNGTEKLIGGSVFEMGKEARRPGGQEARRKSAMSKGRETAKALSLVRAWWGLRTQEENQCSLSSWETLTAQPRSAFSNTF